ncbi:MAG: glycosyltransferase family 2 protein [Candidatus Glassbacteria bacterium]|nr:glycosyltransferase family 2 protein [Candidatus Glassbacteria bacterium]
MPLVSVIIPMYNSRQTIARAVGSVFEQTVADWELVVVDDGSDDGSDRVLEELVSGHHWASVIRQANAGASAARNRGMEEANAGLVAFLDADDQWTPDFLETVLGLRERFSDCSLWGTRYLLVGPHGLRLTPEWIGLPESEGVIENYLATAGGSPPVVSGSAIIAKECLLEAGGFPEGVRWGEDLDTWLRLSLRCHFAVSPHFCHLCYIDRPGRMSLRPQLREYPLLTLEVERAYAEKINLLRRHELAEYFHWLRLTAAGDSMRLGQRKTARGLLEAAKTTERFRAAWRRAVLKSIIPGWLMRLITIVRGGF